MSDELDTEAPEQDEDKVCDDSLRPLRKPAPLNDLLDERARAIAQANNKPKARRWWRCG